MSLPLIQPYRLEQEEFANRAGWRAESQRAALLVHDFQNHFVNVFDRAPESQIETAINQTRWLIDTAYALEIPVYFTAQPPRQSTQDRALLTDFWGEGLQDDAAAEIISEVAPQATDRVLTKWRYSAFARTSLEEELKESGRDQLIICGVYAHIGCLATALEAFMRDIQAFVISDATADFSAEDHRMACTYAASRCACVLGTEEVLAQLAAVDLQNERGVA